MNERYTKRAKGFPEVEIFRRPSKVFVEGVFRLLSGEGKKKSCLSFEGKSPSPSPP